MGRAARPAVVSAVHPSPLVPCRLSLGPRTDGGVPWRHETSGAGFGDQLVPLSVSTHGICAQQSEAARPSGFEASSVLPAGCQLRPWSRGSGGPAVCLHVTHGGQPQASSLTRGRLTGLPECPYNMSAGCPQSE